MSVGLIHELTNDILAAKIPNECKKGVLPRMFINFRRGTWRVWHSKAEYMRCVRLDKLVAPLAVHSDLQMAVQNARQARYHRFGKIR